MCNNQGLCLDASGEYQRICPVEFRVRSIFFIPLARVYPLFVTAFRFFLTTHIRTLQRDLEHRFTVHAPAV